MCEVIECITISEWCKIHQFNGWFEIVVILHRFSFVVSVIHNDLHALTSQSCIRIREFFVQYNLYGEAVFFYIDESIFVLIFLLLVIRNCENSIDLVFPRNLNQWLICDIFAWTGWVENQTKKSQFIYIDFTLGI